MNIIVIILSVICTISSIFILFFTLPNDNHNHDADALTTNTTNSTAAILSKLPHLHKIDQKWIDYNNRFINLMRSMGGINSSNAYEFHLFNAYSLLMYCINYEVDSNDTISIIFLPLCDNAIYKEYVDPHGYGQPRDQILRPDMAAGVGANSWHDLAGMYLQARGIL